MDDSALTVDQLDALSRAVPDDTERKDIKLYLKVATLPQLWAPVAVREGGTSLQLGPCCSFQRRHELGAHAATEQADPA